MPKYDGSVAGLIQFENMIITIETANIFPDNSVLHFFVIGGKEIVSIKNKKHWMNINYYQGDIKLEALRSFANNCYHYNDCHFFKAKGRSTFMTRLNHIVSVNGSEDRIKKKLVNTSLMLCLSMLQIFKYIIE